MINPSFISFLQLVYYRKVDGKAISDYILLLKEKKDIASSIKLTLILDAIGICLTLNELSDKDISLFQQKINKITSKPSIKTRDRYELKKIYKQLVSRESMNDAEIELKNQLEEFFT